MKRLCVLAISLGVTVLSGMAASCSSMSQAQESRKVVRYNATTDPTMTVAVDSVEYRSDLTRLYGKLIGRPHTSGRIDAVSLLSGKTALAANDIDGVDFNRYFQWEDDGVIVVEIDFPATKPLNAAQLILTTTKGESVTNLKRK